MSSEEDNRKIENTIKYCARLEVLEEGGDEAKKQDAINLIKNGVSLSVISKSLGMSIEELEKLDIK